MAFETRFSGRPEQFRRALKVFFANWLAHADLPRSERRLLPDKSIPLFEPDLPGEPALPSPAVLKTVLGLWLSGIDAHGSSRTGPPVDFKLSGSMPLFDADDRDKVNRSAVILGLALELYFREHDHFPPSLAELVKAGYLKSIPLDPFGKGDPMHYRVADNLPRAIVWSVGASGRAGSEEQSVDKSNKRVIDDSLFEIVAPRKRR